MEEIVNIINSVGFPIVACIFLYKQNCNMLDGHKTEIDTLKECIQTCTMAVSKMDEKLDVLIDVLRDRRSCNED